MSTLEIKLTTDAGVVTTVSLVTKDGDLPKTEVVELLVEALTIGASASFIDTRPTPVTRIEHVVKNKHKVDLIGERLSDILTVKHIPGYIPLATTAANLRWDKLGEDVLPVMDFLNFFAVYDNEPTENSVRMYTDSHLTQGKLDPVVRTYLHKFTTNVSLHDQYQADVITSIRSLVRNNAEIFPLPKS